MPTYSVQSFIPHIDAVSCVAVTEASGSTFARAFGVLTPERRKALSIVYAVFRILDDCVDELSDPLQQNEALDFWQARIDAAYEGQPDHAVAMELAPVVARFKIPQTYFSGLIAGCRMDIIQKRYATINELYDYCYRVASLVGLCCLKIFEYDSPSAEKMAVDLGQAFQLTNILRDVKNDLQRDRIYLPADLLSKHHYTEDDLRAGSRSENFLAMMDELNALAETYYAAAWTEFAKDSDGKLASARLMALAYRKILRKLHKRRWPIFGDKISLNFWEKLCLYWQFKRNS
jgi:phytoene synthase